MAYLNNFHGQRDGIMNVFKGNNVFLSSVCRAENEGVKLWIPSNSDYRLNNDWMFDNFPRDIRFNSIIFVADNVLKADVIRAMYRKARDSAL